jgi:outer membrane protein OmpA-like peptidoglycan-associated protein
VVEEPQAALSITAPSATDGSGVSDPASAPTAVPVEAAMPVDAGPAPLVEAARPQARAAAGPPPAEPVAGSGPPGPVAEPTVEISAPPLPGHEEIAFAFDSAEVDPAGQQVLDRIGAVLGDRVDLKARIVGYTDNVGPKNYNAWLSRRRAEAVASYLERLGIAAARLEVLTGNEPDAEGGAEASGRIVRVDFIPEA